jgi:medium-chain acyl-[acyl-carrier-protein] hydrolase
MEQTATWIKQWVPRPGARVRLFCFPWAGGSAVAFRRWAVTLPPEVELCAVEYPGRGTREEEAPRDEVEQLAAEAGLAAAPLLDRPFAVVGFSLGAVVAFEWLRRPARRPAPDHFFPCARRAPHLPPRLPSPHDLPDEQLLEQIQRRFGAIPEVLLRERELLARFLVPLRADLLALQRYVHAPGGPLDCPISAFGGRSDPDVTPAELDGWSAHTRGSFGVVQVEAGHFFADSPVLHRAVLRSLPV